MVLQDSLIVIIELDKKKTKTKKKNIYIYIYIYVYIKQSKIKDIEQTFLYPLLMVLENYKAFIFLC